jgi:hypothetical protein
MPARVVNSVPQLNAIRELIDRKKAFGQMGHKEMTECIICLGEYT